MQKPEEVIEIKPIVIHSKTETSIPKEEIASNLNHDEVLNKLEKAIETRKRAITEEEIANNVLLALEKNVHKPVPIEKITPDEVEPIKVIEVQEEKQARIKVKEKQEATIVIKKEVKPDSIIITNTDITPVSLPKTEMKEVPKTPKIVLVSQQSHSEITQTNTLIVDTHPEETLTLYNGSKAYVLDESAETETISVDEEEFANLPWSKTYGVVEESEHFELNEEI